MRGEVRVEALRGLLGESGHEAALITIVSNVAYLTAFDDVFDTEDAHVALVTADEQVIFTDSRYSEALEGAAKDTEWRVVTATTRLLDSVCEHLSAAGVTDAVLESGVPYERFTSYSDAFGGTLTAVSDWVETLRQVKDAEEIARISAAQELTDRAFDHILAVLREGVSERDIALELEFFMRREGSEGVAFAPIVASGPNSSRPHATVSERTLAVGDFVVMDFGARVGGYCADMTRTVVMGAASDRHREVYEAVLAANLAGLAAVRSEQIGRDADAAARAVIVDRGFGELFGHGLGHGVGLEVHELPGMGPRAEKPLPEMSVVTVEPGVYVPGFGGVRIEDLVVVEAAGPNLLTRSTKDLIEV